MKQPRLEYHTTRMGIAVLLAIGYAGGILSLGTLFGSSTLDGIIGVLLGLYICAHPVAHMLDLLYLPSGARYELISSDAGLWWIAINIVVLLVGVSTIIIGANRFVQPSSASAFLLLYAKDWGPAHLRDVRDSK